MASRSALCAAPKRDLCKLSGQNRKWKGRSKRPPRAFVARMERCDIRGITLPSVWAGPGLGYAQSATFAEKSNCLFRLPRHVAATGQQPGDRNIFVNLFPMKANPADFNTLALLGCRAQQARKPRERHTEIAAIRQVDPHGMIVKADGRCRNGHATLSEYVLDCSLQCAG